MDSSDIYDQVNERYGSIVKSSTGRYEEAVAKAFGYSEDELVGVPEGANLGLSCGNPTAFAKLGKGETVIDLGSGAGFDVFIAAKKVGSTGQVIGVDMNKTMVEKARAIQVKTGASNVQFVEGLITSIPLPDAIADCIISNCVINLVPATEKEHVFREIYRLLKPGGRVAISDILARKELTHDMRNNIALYVGCIAGASRVTEYERFLNQAGFSAVVVVDSQSDLNVYFNADSDGTALCCNFERKPSGCEPDNPDDSPNPREDEAKATQLGIMDLNEWAGSFHIYAVK